MIEVEVPGKGIAEFPDGMNPRDIEHSLFSTFPDLADTPQKQEKAKLLAARADAMKGVSMGEMQSAVASGLEEGLLTPFKSIPRPNIEGLVSEYEGVRRALGSKVDLPAVPPSAKPVAQTIDTVFEKLISATESLETPLGVGLTVSGAVAPRAVAAVVGVMGAGQATAGVKETVQAAQEGNVPGMVGGVIDTAIGSAMAAGGAAVLKTDTPLTSAAVEKLTKPTEAEIPEAKPAIAPEVKPTEPVSEPVPKTAPLTEAEQAGVRAELNDALGQSIVEPAKLAEPEPVPEPSVGPGAASRSDFPTSSQLTQLSEAIRGTEPVKQPLSDQIKNQATAIRQQATAKWESGVNALKSLGANAVAALKGELPWTSFDDTLGKFSGEQNKTDFALQNFTRDIRRAVPDKLRREAIVNWMQADGDIATLQSRAAASRPEHRRGYELAQKLTPDEQVLAENVRSFLDSKLQDGIDAGILKAGVENYVTQIWDRPNPITQKLVGEIFTGKLAPNFKYARKRIFDSYFEGEQAGYKPKIKDIGALIAVYDQAFSKAIASRRLIKSLHEGKAKDGRPLVEVSGVSALVAEKGTPEALLIKPKAKPEELGGYLPIDHPALRGWKWAGTDPETGASILYQGDLLVHPEIHGHLKNVLSSSALRQNVFSRFLLETVALLKQSHLALSGFHFTQEGTHAASHRVNPLAPEKIDFTVKDQSALVDHGLQIADYRAYQAFAEGLSGTGSIYERVPVAGKWLTRYNEYLFQEYIPRLKMTMAMDALARNRERFGKKLSDDQILALTSRQSNAAFGALNYTMLGRNQTLQDIFRLVTLAPDFLEARFRFAAQALTKTGTEQRVALALQALTLYIGARIINQAIDGDPHWEPKYAFSIIANKRQYGIRSVVEDSMHLVTDPGMFVGNRLSPLSRSIVEFVTSRNWQGVKRNFKEQIQDVADWLIPITVDKRPEATRVDQALAASGVTVKTATATQRLYDKLKEFKEGNQLLTKEEKQGMTAPSEYSTLRRAIMAGDEAASRKEYEALLHPTDGTKAKTPRQLRDHFTESVTAPFSGSRRAEKAFIQSLDDKGKKLYEEALAERKGTAMQFREWQKKWMQESKGSPSTPSR